MNKEQIECVVWLMMEYEARRNSLDPLELAVLLDLRTEWNIERAKSVMLSDGGTQNADNSQG